MSSRPLQGSFVVAARTRSELCKILNLCLQKEEIIAYIRTFEVEECAFKKVKPRATLAVAARRDYLSNQSGLCISNPVKPRSLTRSHPIDEQNIEV